MTKAEAIAMLKRIQEPEAWEPQINQAAFEALDMAIEALDCSESPNSSDTISRQAAIDAIESAFDRETILNRFVRKIAISAVRKLPPAQPEKETAKRVLWTGWKGTRDTRYKCPNCKKPVKNDDVYCHRCGQKLMFPHISFTDYIPGEKQELIVRWDDE